MSEYPQDGGSVVATITALTSDLRIVWYIVSGK